MNLEKFNLLQRRFEDQKFELTQRSTQLVLYYGSYLGNLLSIILSYFFVAHLTDGAAIHFGGQEIILPIFIILFLTMFEFAKRFTFANVVTSYLTVKRRTTSFFLGLLFVLLLVGSTFYLSLSGASTYANKTNIIIANTDSIVNTQVDSLNSRFKEGNIKLEERISYLYKAAGERRNKSLKPIEITQVKDWETAIINNNKILETKVAEIKLSYGNKANEQKDQSNKSQWAFILISAFIEIIILVGCGFNVFYNYTSFKEQKDILDNSDNYKKLIIYNSLLKILFNNGKVTIKVGAIIPSFNKFKELVRQKVSIKDLKEFFTTCNHLGIIKTIGTHKEITKPFEQAQEILGNHLTIDSE